MPWAQPKDVSIKIQNMDTLFRYVHSMDTFTKEYFCIHQIGKQAVAQLPTCKNSDLARKTAEQDQEPDYSELSALSRCKDMIGAAFSVI